MVVLELCHKSGQMLGVGLLGDENSDDTSTSLVTMATLSHPGVRPWASHFTCALLHSSCTNKECSVGATRIAQNEISVFLSS